MLFQETSYYNTLHTANIKHQACMKTCLIEIFNIKINNGIYQFVFEIDVTQRADAGCCFMKKKNNSFLFKFKKSNETSDLRNCDH